MLVNTSNELITSISSAPFEDVSSTMKAESYGFIRSGDVLVPEIVISKPEDLPDPCKCGKCARKNGCPCRVAGIRCCKYCKCKAGDLCRNPITEWTNSHLNFKLMSTLFIFNLILLFSLKKIHCRNVQLKRVRPFSDQLQWTDILTPTPSYSLGSNYPITIEFTLF